VYAPTPFQIFESTLGKFAHIQVDDQRIAIPSDKHSYVELPPNCLDNCRMSYVTICECVTPIYGRSRETCLSSLFFESSGVHSLCTRIILPAGFAPLFKKILLFESWLYAQEELMILESKCLGAKEHRTETITIPGAGVLCQEAGCSLCADRLLLPSGRQFESRTESGGTNSA
jgi:hypothetical protein